MGLTLCISSERLGTGTRSASSASQNSASSPEVRLSSAERLPLIGKATTQHRAANAATRNHTSHHPTLLRSWRNAGSEAQQFRADMWRFDNTTGTFVPVVVAT